MKPYYDRDGITIYCGDNAKVLPRLSDIDLMITSPPYNLGITSGGGFSSEKGVWSRAMQAQGLANGYSNHKDTMPFNEYVQWQKKILRLMWTALSNDGAIYYNHKPRIQNGEVQLPLMFNPDLPIRQIVIWARAGGINHSPTYYLPTYEWIMIFAKPKFRLKSKSLGIGDVWQIAQETNTPHPAPFPVALPAKAIATTDAQAICDPYMGSGTTLVAAQREGRRAVGIELSEEYCQIAVERLASPTFFSLPQSDDQALRPKPKQMKLF